MEVKFDKHIDVSILNSPFVNGQLYSFFLINHYILSLAGRGMLLDVLSILIVQIKNNFFV